jgi:membrane-associated phospholipid phosphatase
MQNRDLAAGGAKERSNEALFSSRDAAALGSAVALFAVSLLWNLQVGLRFSPALGLMLLPAIFCFSIAAVYSTVRVDRIVARSTLYVGLWLIFPVIALRLTDLASISPYSFKDDLLVRADAAMGFHWIGWVNYVASHGLLEKIQTYAYMSTLWQPLLAFPILVVWGAKDRSAEFMISMLLALVLTSIGCALVPAVGPAEANGFNLPYLEILHGLRAGSTGPFPYVGIVSFPSFHAGLAVLYAAAHRGNRWSFPIFLTGNVLVLFSTPYSGAHYLTDVVAGIILGLVCVPMTGVLLRTVDRVSAKIATRRVIRAQRPY